MLGQGRDQMSSIAVSKEFYWGCLDNLTLKLQTQWFYSPIFTYDGPHLDHHRCLSCFNCLLIIIINKTINNIFYGTLRCCLFDYKYKHKKNTRQIFKRETISMKLEQMPIIFHIKYCVKQQNTIHVTYDALFLFQSCIKCGYSGRSSQIDDDTHGNLDRSLQAFSVIVTIKTNTIHSFQNKKSPEQSSNSCPIMMTMNYRE